ncbi:hypothetical protein AC1031_001746 [Aphanomyces cochlioides]|nr:hypothetical protein AC1031_001746 [Aphanomyces cochlioides]
MSTLRHYHLIFMELNSRCLNGIQFYQATLEFIQTHSAAQFLTSIFLHHWFITKIGLKQRFIAIIPFSIRSYGQVAFCNRCLPMYFVAPSEILFRTWLQQEYLQASRCRMKLND